MIRVTAFRWVPPFAQGLVRDLRVRWALEEAGLAYQERLIGPEEQVSADYRALQPFGQVPVYEEGEGADRLILFESGAIVLHVAEKSETLMPADPAARARAVAWMFASLNSIEPHILTSPSSICSRPTRSGRKGAAPERSKWSKSASTTLPPGWATGTIWRRDSPLPIY